VYLLRCADGTLYTGITNNLEKRIKQHNEGKGAKYTRGRGPVALVKSFKRLTKSDALKLEYKLKKLSKAEKLAYKEE
jgi:putative endonuclease